MIARVVRALSSLMSRPVPPPSVAEMDSIRELRATFEHLPVIDTSRLLETEAVWFGYVNQIRECALSGNPREFLRWRPILETMFITFAPYISRELRYLKQLPDWKTRWRDAIREPAVGHPLPYVFHPTSTGTTIHHAYHLARFEERTGQRADETDLVFEFGSGYGSMCRLLFSLGFRGTYVCFDFPSCSAIQRYYLKTAGLPVVSGDEIKNGAPAVVCVSDLDEVKKILGQAEGRRSMFVATWSLSESPISVRDRILPLIASFDRFLVAYYDRFGEVDNDEFFRNWQSRQSDVEWARSPVAHMPRNTYLFGARPESNGNK
jgi:hypothetical protein